MTGLTRKAFEELLPSFEVAEHGRVFGAICHVKNVMLDGTERPIQRPKDSEAQKENYFGKKKRHTRKHITGTTRKKRVIFFNESQRWQVP